MESLSLNNMLTNRLGVVKVNIENEIDTFSFSVLTVGKLQLSQTKQFANRMCKRCGGEASLQNSIVITNV